MSSSSSEGMEMKQPIRRLEIQINNFNVAIQYHVDLLKRHKTNIQKYQAKQEWDSMYKEHINVSRIVKQLKSIWYQMDILRAQVLDSDIDKFDKMTSNARTSIMNAVKDYLELQLILPVSQPQSPKDEDQATSHPLRDSYMQLQKEQQELERQKACLHAWNNLQEDIYQLQTLFVEFNKIVNDQKESVNAVENIIEEVNVNVVEGEQFLKKATRYKVAAYPFVGALLGTCVGGPVGLIAGMKVGGLAALGCGILGFTGASFLKKREVEIQKSKSSTEQSLLGSKSMQKSTSLPENLTENKKLL